MDWADLAVEKLESDICDRRDWKWMWRDTDEDVLAEVREKWAELIREAREESYRLGVA